MALTPTQKAQCRQYLGWSFGFADRDSLLEQAFNGLETKPAEELLITDTLANGGILESLLQIDKELVLSRKRLKADNVGTIQLNRREVKDLRKEGDRYVSRLGKLLGVPVREGGGYTQSLPTGQTTRGGYYPGNYIGK